MKSRLLTQLQHGALYFLNGKKRLQHTLSFLFCLMMGANLSAQTLGVYAFNGAAVCPATSTSVTAQPANAVFSTYSNTGGTCSASTTAFINTGLNTTATVDLAEYNAFTITPNTGYLLTLTTLTFTQFVSSNASPTGTTWELRSSLDGYTTIVGSGTATTTTQTPAVTLPSASFTNIGAVTFRLYVKSMNSASTSWRNENVTLAGAMNQMPANPGNPTSNSPQCSSTGVTLTRTGTPGTGITWYWQTVSNGTSTTNSAATYTANTAGTYYIRARNNTTLAWSSGQGSATIAITPNVSAPVFALGTSSGRCQNSGPITYTATAANSTGITYTLDAISSLGGNSINGATGTVTWGTGWVGNSTITASAAGCSGPVTSTHTITTTGPVSTPVFTAGATTTRCQGAGTVTYGATASATTGITYNLDAASVTGGNTINTATGDVTYAATWSGTNTITASAAGCSGPKTATHTVTVTPTVSTPVFAAGATSTRCQAAGPVTYTATAANSTGITYTLDATSTGAGNTIVSTTGVVTYTAAWTGTSVITASGTGCNGPVTATHTVTTTATVGTPVFTAGPSTTRCQAGGNITYSATAANTSGITYSLDAASVTGGNSVNGSGVVTWAAGWSGATTITASAAGCSGPKTATFIVNTTATVGTPVFTSGTTSTRCRAAGAVTYTATSTNNTGLTYALDAASIAAGNTINNTTGLVTYVEPWFGTSVITATATGCNGPATANHTVSITQYVQTPVFTLGTSSTRCQGAGTVTYTAMAVNATGITYTLDATSLGAGNTINASTGLVTYAAAYAGTSTITATAVGCGTATTATHTATTTATVGTPAFTAGATSNRCQGAGTITYGATATTTTGITYTLDAASITGGNTINAATGAVTFAAAWSGTSTITASAAGCGGPKTAAHTVTITATVGPVIFSAGASSVRCQGAGSITYTATATTNTGINYALDGASIAAGNTINSANGTVTYLAGWTSPTTITATATGCNGPTTASHTVTTTPYVGTPVFASGPTSTRCQGAGTVTYSATATNTTGITYTLDATSSGAGNSVNAASGAVTWAAGWSGTSTITATAAGCGTSTTATHTITITATVGTPVFSLGAGSTRCQGAGTITYSATATTNTGITYSLDATSVGAGNTINNSTGAVTFLAGWTGTSVITVTATGCNGPKSSTHTVTITPTVGTPIFSASYPTIRCNVKEDVSYAATATNATSITYTLDAASLADKVKINASTGLVSFDNKFIGTSYVTATANGCNGPASAVFAVTTNDDVTKPVFDLGNNSIICQASGSIIYNATADYTTGITYTLDAASLTGGNTINAATGEVTYATSWTGTSTITASAAGCNGPQTQKHIVTVVPSVTTPVFNFGSSSTRCPQAQTIQYTATTTNQTGLSYSLDNASLSAGNTINSTDGRVTFTAAWRGVSVITATATGCNGPATSTHTVTTPDFVGTPVFTVGATSTRCQGAGSVTYDASATDNTGITYTLDATSRGAGNTINAATGSVTFVAGWSGTSTITATATGCSGPKSSTHTVTTTATVGTPVFSLGATSNRCHADGTVTYTATATNNTGITYSLDATSTAAGNSIDNATGAVTYVDSWEGTSTITATATGCNGPKTSTHTVTTNGSVGVPVFAPGATSIRCQGAGTVNYIATSTNNTGITYTLDNASLTGGNTINAASGAVTYSASWNGTSIITASAAGCYGPQTATHTVTVTPTVGTPIFTLGASSSRCLGAAVVLYDATATTTTGITYSLNAASLAAGNTINSATGEVTYVAGYSGTTIITASAAGCNGPRTATHTVTVIAAVGVPVFGSGTSSTRCQAAGNVTYTATATTNTGISYALDATSLAAGNTINAANGTVSYVVGWTGTSVITATATGCNGPTSSTHNATTTPFVTTPVFSAGLQNIRCQGGGAVTYDATANYTTGITYTIEAASSAGGNAINAATGQLTWAAGWSGTTNITASAAGCSGPLTATLTVNTTATVGTPIFSLGGTSSRCRNAGIVTYTASATTNTGITYSLDAVSIAAGNTIDVATGTVTYLEPWEGTSVITATATGCNGPRSSTHTVTTNGYVGATVFGLGATSTRCQGAGAVSYSATALNNTGITYTLDFDTRNAGNAINISTGVVTFVAGWSGTSTIVATATGCNGPTSSSHTVITTATVGTPVFVMGASSIRCQGAATVSYNATATTTTGITYSLGAASLAAGNTINAATGDVTYVGSYSGTTIITASAAGCNGPALSTHTATVTASVGTPVFAAGASSVRCQAGGNVTYSATATTNTGLTYTLDATSTAAGNFINATTGRVTFLVSWTGTSLVTVTATGCNGPTTATHTITTTPTVGIPVFAAGTTATRCQGAGTTVYNATATDNTGITYALDATSRAAGNNINAATGAVTFVTSWTGNSTVTATATGCNGPFAANLLITTTPTVTAPVFTLGTTSGRCRSAGTVTYTATANYTTGITYSLDAASVAAGNTINITTGLVTYVEPWQGTSTITASAAGCNGPATSTHTVTTNGYVGVPTFSLTASSVRCQGGLQVTYTATALNGTGISYTLDATSSAAGNTINASTGAVSYTGSWIGTSTITATATGCSGPTSASHTATTTATVGTPVFAMGAASTRCQGAATIDYTATATTTTGITYSLNASSITAGNTINAATGAVTFLASYSGTTIVTASAAGCNGPSNATHTVTVTATVGTPVFTLGAASSRCQGYATVTYTASATTNTGITYTLDATSLAQGNLINSSNGLVTWSASWNGTSVITATATGCNGPTTSTHSVTITPSVSGTTFALGSSSTRCKAAGTVTYTATATNTTGITYTLDFISRLGGNTINTTTGVVTYVASWTGSSTITANAAGCNGPDVAYHTVSTANNVTTPVFSAGSTSTRCQAAGVVTYTATSTNTTSLTYSLDATSTAAGNTINVLTGSVTYLPGWTGASIITATAFGCAGPVTSTHTATTTATVAAPVFTLGATSTRCNSAGTVTYTATASTTLTYSINAAAISAGNTINSTTGILNYAAGYVGTVTITATAAGCGTPATTHNATSTATVGKPAFTLGATSTRCQTAGSNTYTATSSNLTGISYSLDNASITAGNTINTANGVVTYVQSWYGTSTITATATGCNGPATSTHTVTTTGNGTPSFTLGDNSTRIQAAATVTYTAVANNGGAITYSLDAASVAGGNSINSTTGAVTYNLNWSGTTIITASVIGCGGVVTDTHTVTVSPNSVFKQLYLSDPSQALDRTDPVATADATTASTAVLAVGGRMTFTQLPGLCGNLNIKTGRNITITNYITVSTGTMPANPNITAVLRYGTTTILTLTNPTYAGGLLTWTGTRGTDLNVPAGQAIVLEITNNQTGVTFSIQYDSQTRPSKVQLPVSTFIDIISLDVYSAAYPGGTIITGAVAGRRNYIRAVVSDPFGSADITGLNYTITPTGTTVAATSVATAGCTRTFEYVWQTPATASYVTIVGTAREGFENTVTANKTIEFSNCTNCPPIANDDSASGAGGSPIIMDVLANDTDPNDNINPSSLTIVTQPTNGSAIVSNGKIVYLPNGTYAGNDDFTYRVCDLTSPAPLCAVGTVRVSIDPTVVDPCSESSKTHTYYIPYPEQDARTALIASSASFVLPIPSDNIRSIISIKIPYPGMVITWDHWEDGYESNILNPTQSTTLIWGDGNPYNGIAPGYNNDILPVGGSIVLDNTMPANPRVAANRFYDGRDKIASNGEITLSQVSGEPSIIGLQCMKTNVTSTSDFGTSFTIPVGQDFNSQDFRYTALFIRPRKIIRR